MKKPFERVPSDIARVTAAVPQFESSIGLLVKVTGATAIASSNYRWTYSWAAAEITGNTPAQKAVGLIGNALSVSELSNNALTPTKYSYGITGTNIPAGFLPQQIPVGTYVWIVPQRTTTGSMIWLIVNTQAIDGVCSE